MESEFRIQSGRFGHTVETGHKTGFKIENPSVLRIKQMLFQKTGLFAPSAEIALEGKVYSVNRKSYEKWKTKLTHPDFAKNFPMEKQLELISKYIEIKNRPMLEGGG